MTNLMLIDIDSSNENFDKIYPDSIRNVSKVFWTPLEVAKRASELLVTEENTKVLDVGSGVGKFCLIGALHTKGIFYGVEQRNHLVTLSKLISITHSIDRVNFIHSNILNINFSDYQAFYLYNPFYENFFHADKLDKTIIHSVNHYSVYNNFVKAQLDTLPLGTKVITYHGYHDEIPLSYKTVTKEYDDKLVLWEKTKIHDERFSNEEKLLNLCVNALIQKGFVNINYQNITHDPLLKIYTQAIMKSKRGLNPIMDTIIEEYIKKYD